MTRHGGVALLVCLAVLASGCVYQGYNRVAFQNPRHLDAETAEDDADHAHTLLGFVDSTGTVDVAETCPDGFAMVAHYQTSTQASWIPIVPLLLAPFASGSTVEFRCLSQ